ncbi:MAG: hypothetical protein IKE43_04025 [Coriobacteriales bacterium]|nr:hypothetical protein [Coriobacteriales bacterium]
MKKYLALLLAFVLVLLPLPAAMAQEAEVLGLNEPPASAEGNWYADLSGVPLELTLAKDGTYTLVSSALPNESHKGTWEQRDGFVWLDGDDTSPLNLTTGAVYSASNAQEPAEDSAEDAVVATPADAEKPAAAASAEATPGNSAESASADSTESLSVASEEELLVWTAADIVFYRTQPAAYIPAAADPSAPLDAFAGYWKSSYVSLSGTPVAASAMGDNTDIYIEGERVALGGELFGDVFVNFTFSEGTLSATVGDALSIEIVLQKDNYLRMTLTSPTGEMTIYLAKAPSGLTTAAA